jgi:hypothetical protein
MTLDLSRLTVPTREHAFHDAKTRIRLDHGWPNIRYYSSIGVVSRRGSTLQM